MYSEHLNTSSAPAVDEMALALDRMAEGFLVLGSDYRVQLINAEGLRIDGRPREQIVGRHLLEVWPEVEHMPTWPAYNKALAEQVPVEIVYRHKSELHDAFLEVRAYPVGDRLVIFYRDVTDREQAKLALEQSTRLLQSFVEAVPGNVFAKDRNGRLIIANRGVSELLGKEPAEYLGKTDLEYLNDEAQARVIMATDERIMSSGVAEQLEEEADLADGGRAVWLSVKKPLRDEAGTIIGLIGSSIEITERKRLEADLAAALEEKEALLYEVNHRVKNSLQMIIALLSLQERQSTSAETKRDLADARARISVVGAIHQTLYTTDRHSEVELTAFLTDLATRTVASMSRDDQIKLVVRTNGQLSLDLKTAMPIALLVSELITNALKYAFPDDRKGSLTLSVDRQPDGCRIEVADDGVGLGCDFDLKHPRGVGTQVIAVLAKQLRAKFDIVEQERGCCFRIEVPLEQQEAQ